MRHQRTILRIGVVTLAAIVSAQVFPLLAGAAVWPAASPLLAICAAGAARSASLTALIGLPLLVLALARGRWFCHHLCPTGYLLILVGKFARFRRRPLSIQRVPMLGSGLCLVMLGSALAGLPLLLHLDPLVQFNGFFSVWRGTDWRWVDGLPALSLIVLGLVTAIWPRLWCERICPLGALQALLGITGKFCRHAIARKPAPQPATSAVPMHPGSLSAPAGGGIAGRRIFLALLFGTALGWVLKRKGVFCLGPDGPIRPPGAVAEPVLWGLCSRCGSCMRTCPEGIIVPDLGTGGPGSWLTPRLDFSRRYCNEWCRLCTGACPTGAISRLALEAKRALSIGTARVDRGRCLAWRDAQYCMVCHEFCSYQAVRIVEHNGVNCPEVDKALCRGCGACQSRCPAEPIRAIVVHTHEQAPVEELRIANL
ncbi:MAG: 4Fe-4S binding protein [Kiritimatiellia bacterium]|jgi:ferredoxin